MTTRSVLTSILILFVLLPIILVPLDSGFAQDTKGRWVIGFHGGGNMWFDDYNKRKIGEGGELMLRYGISRAFSAGFVVGYEELKSNQDPALNGVTYLKLQAIPGSIVGWIHLVPDKSINPHLYFGLGAMQYKRTTGGGVGVPENKGQFQTSIHVPFGVGLDAFVSKDVSIAIDFGYRVVDTWTDGRQGKLSGYATAKAGVNFYLGTSAAEKEERASAEALRLKEAAEAEARRVKELADAEARRVKQQADADAEARRVKELADAEARRLKELADAEARRLAEQKGRDTTIIILEKGKTVILKGVNFEFDKATLTMDSEIILERALNALNASPDLNVLIVGHTDNVGSAAYNQKLSLRRAEAVKSWLVRKGISVKRLSVAGKGFDEPIDSNTTDAGRANNRRIEFHVLE